MKTRYKALDISAVVRNMQSELLGLRAQNLYDINSKTYEIKFTKPDFKRVLLIESGIRIHPTNFQRDKSEVPSVFTLKMRKFLRTKRLENVQQMGADRVVDFTFGSGPATHHLIVELYAQGNIILTDPEYNILALTRPYVTSAGDKVEVGQKYPLAIAKQFEPITRESIDKVLLGADKKALVVDVLKKNLDSGDLTIAQVSSSLGIKEDTTIADFDATKTQPLFEALSKAEQLTIATSNPKGYITFKEIASKKKPTKAGEQATEEEPQSTKVYVDFGPLYPDQNASVLETKDIKSMEFPTLGEAVDEFFSKMEEQKQEVQRIAQETAVSKKLEKFKHEHQKRIDGMQEALISNERKAQLIEIHLAEVDMCLNIVRSAIATGMDWTALNALVKEEKKTNPGSIASIIHQLQLDRNTMVLMLSFPEDDEEDVTLKPQLVDIDLALSSYANARKYYDAKKVTNQKTQKTIEKTEQALKAAEDKSRRAMAEAKVKHTIQLARKPLWFEKFYWFISTDNYLVICGRDMQQNELLYKRYLDKNDLYVHADLHGASTCIIKNASGGEVPPSTLSQAGTMTVCLSAAWQAKVVTSAWWVYANQVSKTAPTGEYLTTGSFMIRGKKNFLPPSQLILGFGFLFRLEESSFANHIGERRTAKEPTSLRSSMESMASVDIDDEEEVDDDEEGKPNEVSSSSQANGNGAPNGHAASAPAAAAKTVPPPSKYKIQLVPDPEQEEQLEAEEPREVTASKQKISAYQRRQTKKGNQPKKEAKETKETETKPPSDSEEAAQAHDESEASEEEAGRAAPGAQTAPIAQSAPQKGKAKKGDDLDDEELKARADLLGAKSRKTDKKSKKAEKIAKAEAKSGKKTQKVPNNDKKPAQKDNKADAKNKPKGNQNNNAAAKQVPAEPTPASDPAAPTTSAAAEGTAEAPKTKNCYKCGQPGHISSSCPQIQAQKQEQELEEPDPEDAEEQKQALSLNILDELTGAPIADDVLLYSIPYLAPYAALSNFKYKVKVTPGQTKRGKAGKAAMESLIRVSNVTNREKDLIKSIPDTELTQCMVQNVKLHIQISTLKNKSKSKTTSKKDKDLDILAVDI